MILSFLRPYLLSQYALEIDFIQTLIVIGHTHTKDLSTIHNFGAVLQFLLSKPNDEKTENVFATT